MHQVPLELLCAILMLETGGGANIFGHDPTVAVGWGAVTKSRYLAYRAIRDRTGELQGVGPMQLTSRSLQDEADQAGGCWLPQHNIAVGAHLLRELLDRDHGNLERAARDYNGSGPAAVAYGLRAAALADHFRPIVT